MGCNRAVQYLCLLDGNECGTKDSRAVEKALLEVARLNRVLKGVTLVATEGLLEDVARRGESAWALRCLFKAAQDILLWSAVEAAEDSF